MEVRNDTYRRFRGSGKWIGDNQTAQSSLERVLGWMRVTYYVQRATSALEAGILPSAFSTSPLTTQFIPSERVDWATVLVEQPLTPAVYLVSAVERSLTSELQDQFQMLLKERSRQILDMEETIFGFSQLPENWDSYGGLPISLDVIDEAKGILKTAIILDLPEPWVAPGGDGGIGIQWNTGWADMYIDVVPKEEITYILTPKGGVDEADGVLTAKNVARVLSQFAELAT